MFSKGNGNLMSVVEIKIKHQILKYTYTFIHIDGYL